MDHFVASKALTPIFETKDFGFTFEIDMEEDGEPTVREFELVEVACY